MREVLKKKKQAIGAMGYVCLFLVMLIMLIMTLYMGSVAKYMTMQHHADDSLTDAVLASLVADDIYYFESYEMTGTPVVRFRNLDESHHIFVDCMEDAVADTNDFYFNFSYDTYVCDEVEAGTITITEYAGNVGTKRISSGRRRKRIMRNILVYNKEAEDFTQYMTRAAEGLRSIRDDFQTSWGLNLHQELTEAEQRGFSQYVSVLAVKEMEDTTAKHYTRKHRFGMDEDDFISNFKVVILKNLASFNDDEHLTEDGKKYQFSTFLKHLFYGSCMPDLCRYSWCIKGCGEEIYIGSWYHKKISRQISDQYG